MDGKDYMVNLWLTHPDNDADDCMTGADFDTLEEARACLANLEGTFNMGYYSDCAFVELHGPEVYEVIERPGVLARARKNRQADDAAERSEAAMQAGMAFGCQGYNEAMGYE